MHGDNYVVSEYHLTGQWCDINLYMKLNLALEMPLQYVKIKNDFYLKFRSVYPMWQLEFHVTYHDVRLLRKLKLRQLQN